jgi:hypothetical protein
MRVRPPRVSMPIPGTSCMRNMGSDRVQDRRSPLVASHSPFFVPIASTVFA